MKKKLLAILLSMFMVIGTFVNVVHADGLGDTPTIHDVLRTRPDFALANNELSDGWRNSNDYTLFCQYGEYSDLSLSHNGAYSNEIRVNQDQTTTKVGNNYKITITDGVQGGDLDLLFVMNDNNVLDYIEVTAPNSPDVAGIYAKTISHMKEYLPADLEIAWTNDNGFSLYYDSDDSKLIVKKDATTIEIPGSGILTYSNNTYKYSAEGKTILFNLEYEPSCTSVWLNDVSVSGYDSSIINGTYSFIHAGKEFWLGEWGSLTSDENEKMFKVRINSDEETLTLIEVKNEKLGDELLLPSYAYTQNYEELSITSVAANVFSNTNITYLEIYNEQLNIGDNAFKGCSNLKNIYIFTEALISLGTGVFDNCSSDLVIHVLKDSLNAYITNNTWFPYKDRIAQIYTVDDIVSTNQNFPHFDGEALSGFLWKNENGATAYYQVSEYGSWLVFTDEDEVYYEDLYDYTILDKKVNGDFEIIDYYGVYSQFNMEDEILTSITISNIENYDDSYTILNGTYIPKVTIADVLSMSEDAFPTTTNSGWVDENGNRAYINSDNIKIFNDSVPLNTLLTKDGNNYKYEYDTGYFYVFTIESGALVSITETQFNSIYTPYIFTNPSISKLVGYTGDVEFVTNGKYVNQSTTPVTVEVDGTPLDYGTDFEVTPGSTHIKLKGNYVKTLSVGTHTIKVGMTGYDDITSQFTIVNPTPSPSPSPKFEIPNTGIEDRHSLLKLSSLSLLVIGTYIAIKKKKDN